jgi:L-malate glycosyltransferase
VPVDPIPPRPLRHLTGVKFARTVVTQVTYWPSLVRALRDADIVHAFSASYWSFLLAPLPAVVVARALGKPVIVNYRSGQAPDHLRRSRIARAILARVDAAVVPSTFLRDVFARWGLQAKVIPNVVDQTEFRFRLRRSLQIRVAASAWSRNRDPIRTARCSQAHPAG